MKLSQVGEFGLIELLKKAESGKLRADTVVGIGDDAAAIKLKTQNSKFKNKKLLLITTDTLIENVHFKLKNTSFYDLGYKALAVNISDIAAMGGWPTHALVTIGLPKRIKVEQVAELYKGINHLAKKFKIDIIGGDTIASPRETVISVTLLGEVEKANLLTRAGARVGDAILVTGEFGGPAANKFKVQKSKVKIRLKEAKMIAKSGIATSMIDSSDGLVRSVIEICKASKVGARIRLDSVPVTKGANIDQALYGGEEYELVFTMPKNRIGKIKMSMTEVGEIVPENKGVKLVDSYGKIKPLRSGGYEHFR